MGFLRVSQGRSRGGAGAEAAAASPAAATAVAAAASRSRGNPAFCTPRTKCRVHALGAGAEPSLSHHNRAKKSKAKHQGDGCTKTPGIRARKNCVGV